MAIGFFSRTKRIDAILASAEATPHGLKRTLGPVHVTLLGIGAIIGAGIFATVGTAAAGDAVRPGAGPSLVLSFAITAVACAFTALCYAEFASMVPISGSAYTYAYATLGELIAWIIGWDLIIEYAIGNVAVAISWANYFRSLVSGVGELIHVPLNIPAWLCTDYRTAAAKLPDVIASAPHLFGVPIVVNVVGFAIVALITILLVWGVRESATVNAWMVVLKIVVLMFFVGVALAFVSPSGMVANWQPFQPNGWRGTLTGASVVFFAYIGFDAVSTVAEETRNPRRDLPIGLIGSLAICTLLYVVVSAAFCGLIPYRELVRRVANEQAEPLTMALEHVAPTAVWPRTVVAFGSVVAHTAVLLVFQLGQPRIFFSMARDGLLPRAFARVHPRFHTPHVTTILTGVAVGTLAAFASIDEMVDLTNIGTLFAFALVCIGIPILRLREPLADRAFVVPGGPWLLPALGVASCMLLAAFLPAASWWRFAGWLMIGLAVYFGYGRSRSRVAIDSARGATRTSGWLRIAAVGFLAAATGLLMLPHDVSPREWWRILASAAAPHHARVVRGCVTLLIGMVAAGTGVMIGTREPSTGRASVARR